MAKIFYSATGEGRGHATRVRAVVEQLRARHELVLFASDDAYDFLRPLYQNTDVRIYRINGLKFQYSAQHRLDYIQTGISAALYASELETLVEKVSWLIECEKPDLAITDFEPTLPRAAKRCGVPFVSLDHQHFLLVNDLSELPTEVKLHVALMRSVVRFLFTGQEETIVSSFYSPPALPAHTAVTQVGVLLRPEILSAAPQNKGHLLAYLRKFADKKVLDALASCGKPVKIYGLGRRPCSGNLQFCPVDDARFIEDLATCDALVCTAGNQLVGEAHYLQKPVLAIPEEGNYEQVINGYFLAKSRGGICVPLPRLSGLRVRRFISDLELFRCHIVPEKVNGTPAAVAAIEAHLSRPETSRCLDRKAVSH